VFAAINERSLLIASIALVGCARGAIRDDVTVRGAAPPATQCRWTGEQMLSAGVSLSSAPAGPVIVRFTGRSAAVEAVVRGADASQHRASVRVDGMVFSGWIDAHDLRLRARRPVALAREHMVIERGSAVLVERADGALRVRARFAPFATSAAVECDAIEVGEPRSARASESPSDPVHLRGERASLYASAEGAPVGAIETSGRIPTFSRLETQGGRAHVRATGAVSVDGWLESGSIEEGEGTDCDDCEDYGVADTLDTCDNPDVESGCPDAGPVETWTGASAPITSAPEEGATRVGIIEPGARYYVRDRREGGWISVSPARFAAAPASGGFWVRRR
jgi:hypothetical protein